MAAVPPDRTMHLGLKVLYGPPPMTLVVLCALLAGCSGANESESPHVFLGVPENETSGEGPVGLINGQSIQVHNVSKVREVPYNDYLSAKQAANVVAEEEHHGYVYWAVKEERDVPFDNATAWVDVVERYKSQLP